MNKHEKLTCLDLRELLGDRYRIKWEANGVTCKNWPREEWPWLLEIHCRHGVIYPYGGEILAAWTNRPRVGMRLRSLPFILTSKGDEETVVTFHVSNAPTVLKLLRAYRQRRFAEAQRLRQAAILVRARAKIGKKDCLATTSRTLERTNETGSTQPLASPEFVAPSGVWALPDREPKEVDRVCN